MAAHAFANVYLQSKISEQNNGSCEIQTDPAGHLFSYGVLPTSVTELDLPPWYVSGWLPSRCLEGLESRCVAFQDGAVPVPARHLDRVFGYVSARGVKELLYIPWYWGEDAPFAMDSLFVSYDKPICVMNDDGEVRVRGHDCVLSGGIIVPFAHAAAQYADCDVAPVLQEMGRKMDWRLAGSCPHCERTHASTRTGIHREWLRTDRWFGPS